MEDLVDFTPLCRFHATVISLYHWENMLTAARPIHPRAERITPQPLVLERPRLLTVGAARVFCAITPTPVVIKNGRGGSASCTPAVKAADEGMRQHESHTAIFITQRWRED